MLTFGEKLSDLRKDAKMTQQELADYLGYSKSYISKMENDIVKDISTCLLIDISKKFDVSIDWLLGLPNSVKKLNANEDSKKASAYTGLSSEAIEVLHNFKVSKDKEISMIKRAKEQSTQKAYPFDMQFRITTLDLINKLITEFDDGISYNLSEYNDNIYFIAQFLENILEIRKNQKEFQQVGFNWNDDGDIWEYIPFDFDCDYSNTDYENYQDRQKRYLDSLIERFKKILIDASPYNEYIIKLNSEIEKINKELNEQAEKYNSENN